MRCLKYIAVCLFATLQLFSQQKKLVELIHADSLVGKKFDSKTVRELIGNVHLKHENIYVWCDRAIQYVDENRIEAYGNLKVKQDTLILEANQGVYLGDKKIALCEGNVKLTDGRTTLEANYGNYDAQKKIANFKSNVKLVDSTTIITAEQLFYYRTEKKSIAVGNVAITNLENNITIYGGYFENYDSTKYSVIKNNPKLVQIDTSSSGEIDTLIVIGKFMEAFRDTNISMFSATDSVIIVRGNLSAVCGDVFYYDKKELIILWRNPVVWYENSQISGDSIVVKLKDRRIDEVYVYGSAFAIDPADSSYPERFNQLKGKTMRIKFKENKIDEVYVEKNAMSLYYIFETDETNERKPNGVNYVSGDSVWIKFKDGKMHRIKIIGGIEGVYYPEELVQGKESNFNLEGFNYIKRKPEKNAKLEIVWVK
ncbi:OstA-like protein [Candidatus Chrysopegis kryptomonas]|uniref:OstA-like protein n=1 Tax=Candidatus Chryseopegocella kryptomonas TaxID=1633643 RepID=A0A0P1MV43_9BACT|nr:OstA-like protein [Candidatus Chrysopegis kryptomonas]CUS99729.1 OstA-like protein [Candidatus Chrysopegis kryptomonas]